MQCLARFNHRNIGQLGFKRLPTCICIPDICISFSGGFSRTVLRHMDSSAHKLCCNYCSLLFCKVRNDCDCIVDIRNVRNPNRHNLAPVQLAPSHPPLQPMALQQPAASQAPPHEPSHPLAPHRARRLRCFQGGVTFGMQMVL